MQGSAKYKLECGHKTLSNDREVSNEILTATSMFQMYLGTNKGTNDNPVLLNRNCQIQDGDHKTGSNDISASRKVSNQM